MYGLPLSAWISIGVCMIAATMMHPTFASLIAIVLIAIGQYLVRLTARHEARVEYSQKRRVREIVVDS